MHSSSSSLSGHTPGVEVRRLPPGRDCTIRIFVRGKKRSPVMPARDSRMSSTDYVGWHLFLWSLGDHPWDLKIPCLSLAGTSETPVMLRWAIRSGTFARLPDLCRSMNDVAELATRWAAAPPGGWRIVI